MTSSPARSRRRVVPSLLLMAGLAALLPQACAEPSRAVTLCAVGGTLYGSRCPTRCESQCALASRAGCQPEDCVAACDAAEATKSDACLDAAYDYWRCLRLGGLPEVRCEGEDGGVKSPVFRISLDVCVDERDARDRACPSEPTDAGASGDGGGGEGAPVDAAMPDTAGDGAAL